MNNETIKLSVKRYEYKKVESESTIIELPKTVSYFFETGIRRSIKITPSFASDGNLMTLDVVCVYLSFECKVEKFSIIASDINEIYYSEKHKHNRFINSLVNMWLDERTKEQFEADLNSAIKEISKP